MKNIQITEDLHKTIKLYCVENDILIRDFIKIAVIQFIKLDKK